VPTRGDDPTKKAAERQRERRKQREEAFNKKTGFPAALDNLPHSRGQS
jgi:hypothetical protein